LTTDFLAVFDLVQLVELSVLSSWGSDRRLITIISQTANPPLQRSIWRPDTLTRLSRSRGCQSSWGFTGVPMAQAQAQSQAQNSRQGSVAAYRERRSVT